MKAEEENGEQGFE